MRQTRILEATPSMVEENRKCIMCLESIELKERILSVTQDIGIEGLDDCKVQEYIHMLCYCESNRGSLYEMVQQYKEKLQNDLEMD